MLRNYFKIAWRSLRKDKVFSLINIAGLSIGTTCCLIIGIYVFHELSYDRFFPNANHIYRVVQEQEQAGDLYQVAITPAPLKESLKENYPEVLDVTAFTRIFNDQLFKFQDKSFEEGGGLYVDSTFFEIFPLPMKNGSLHAFSNSANSILLTEDMALKYFGDDNPIGKVINIDHGQDFIVAAVMENPPSNWHIKFNYLLPMKNLLSHRDFTSWGSNWMYTYILLKETADANVFETKIKNLLSDNIGSPDWQPTLYLQSLTDIHLHSNFDFNTDFARTNSIQSIYLFGAIGLIIILISCINFINLTTAKSFQRDKETGVRKVAGAKRKQLIYQFLGESLLFVLVSLVFAIALAQLLLPYFANLSGLPLTLNLLETKNLIFLLFGILAITGLLSGIYPALFLSSFSPLKMLGGPSFLISNVDKRQLSLRKILVVSQFALSVILIVGAIVIRQQMHYVLDRNLGFDKEHILYIPIKGDLGNNTRYQSFRNTLLQQTSIVQVTRTNSLPIHHEGSFGGVEWEGMPANHQDFLMNYFEVDEGFVETYGLEILAGANFPRRKPADSVAYYLINETALKTMQMDDPIGKRLEEGRIVGVVNDFNFQSAFNRIGPMILRSEPENMNRFISIRTVKGKMQEAVKAVHHAYKQFNPAYPVEYHFLDESIDALYSQQIRSGKLINLFAGLAIFISCLGLLGLASFTALRRVKEIGIRKVNGAKMWEVMAMLNKDFVKWVVIAFMIASPIAWYVMTRWLENFAYKTELSWWVFVLAGLLALGIALLTVSWQSWKAATRNPVEALRYE